MEIINAHVHMIDMLGMAKKYPNLKISTGLIAFKNLKDTIPLLNPENLFKQMEEAGITKAVIYACEAPIIYASNQYVYELCKTYPNKLIGFASVNPLDKNAVFKIQDAIINMGMKGIKFHPPLQNFYPNDKKIFPLYKKVVELNVPIVFHIGSTPFGSLARLDQANPILIDEVASSFPELRIMLTHLGTLWHNEAFMVVEKNPNVFIDTAAYLYEIKELLNINLIKRISAEKIIFGTDYPMPFDEQVHCMSDFIACIKSLAVSDKIKKKFFSENFYSLLTGKKYKDLKLKSIL